MTAAGYLDDAEAVLKEALDSCVEAGCVAEAGRCHLAYADLEQRRSNTAAALMHIDEAVRCFRDYGATFFVQRAVAKKLQLQDIAGSDA